MPSTRRKLFADFTIKILSCNADERLSARPAQSSSLPLELGSDRFTKASVVAWRTTLVLLLTSILAGIVGCGSGGYAGSGITSLTTSSVTIDAGQSFENTAVVADGAPPTWTLSGAGCSGASCGTLSPATGATVTYTAPASITSQMQVTATASLPGTNSSQTVTITVNPVPVISGTLPSGDVGVPYTATLQVTGGTIPFTWSAAGSLPAGLTLDPKTGSISGTPTTAGPVTFTAQATDSSAVPYTAKASESIAISSPAAALSISGTLAAGTVGTAYSAQLNATGGVSPYTFSVSSGSLPAGLSLNASTGAITGTPTTAGQASFNAQVQDSAGTTASGSFGILINPANGGGGGTLTLSNLPNATVGASYTATLGVTGGTAPYICTLDSGSLPAGLTMAANCAVSGTPTAAGVATFHVSATDSSNPSLMTSGLVSLTVQSASTTLTLTPPPNATTGQPYTGTIGVTGGTGPYICSLASGTLPAGLTLAANCQLSGTPTVPGVTTVNVTATDSGNPPKTSTAPVTITILAPSTTLTLTAPPSAIVGTPYTGTIGVTGGASPYTCTIASGILPAGLTLASDCVISGTPTAPGVTTVNITATDSSNPPVTATAPVSLTVLASGATLTITPPPNATVGQLYTGTIGVTGGIDPYTCSIASGTLPAGLTLGANCLITGTPTTAGTTTVSVTATDSSNPPLTTTSPVSLTVQAAPTTLTFTAPPSATVGIPYAGLIGVSGGTAPYTCSLASGTMPAGLTLDDDCLISGTPTAPGTTTLSVTATDSSDPTVTATGPVSLTIQAPIVLTLTPPPIATLGLPYLGTIGVTGGTGPYICSVVAGTLPSGLTLDADCTITGTPSTPGATSVTITATDSSTPPNTATAPVVITVLAPSIPLVLVPPADATVGTPYTGTIGVIGGTAPYTCTIVSGTLPAGLTLAPTCQITGTPTVAGTATVSVTATDSSNPTQTSTSPVSLTVLGATATLTLGEPPSATTGQPYTGTIGVTGGASPYSCTLASGSLPDGLNLGANCQITGTPTTPGVSTVNITATDSSNPVLTTAGPVNVTVLAAGPTLTITPPPNATVGEPYSGDIGVAGGVAPYMCTIASGSLPQGLTLGANCTITGTPVTPGTTTVNVTATDSSNPVLTLTAPVALTIQAAPTTLTFTAPPTATVGVPYSGAIGVDGGIAPYTCSSASGALPAGLTLGEDCLISGTPTVAGSATIGVTATDASEPAITSTGPVTLTVQPAIVLTLTPPPAGTVGVPYTGAIAVTGGTAPYTCTVASGTMPAGLTLAADCSITGTPTAPGTSNVTITATDSSTPANTTTAPVSMTVLAPAVSLTLAPPADATVGTPYTGAIGVMGGTPAYHCTLASGTMPAGLTLGAACNITGTPTTSGTSTITVTATDSATPTPNTFTGQVAIKVNPVAVLTLTGSLPKAIVNTAYTQTLTAAGGIPPYTYSISSGSLPAGLTLTASTGTISGTPTQVGASSFTLTVADSEGTPQTANLPLVLQVVYAQTDPDAELTGPYAFLFQGYDDVLLGVLAYQTSSVGSFTADGRGGISAAEVDSNHQTSNPTGNTVSSQPFVGSYTLGTDNRGFLTITTLNPDGTTGATSTFAITAKAPVSPATVSTQVGMIEYDNDGLQGTRGSGTMLAQTATDFPAGLNGSFAFGVSGDTPCLPTCTIGILSGPAAAVGQFTTNGSTAITNGTSDLNISTTNYPNRLLSGSYTLADSNGRLALSMSTAGMPIGVYPSDYAVYLVNANQAFLMSTDKHSSYVLLAGTAQKRTQTTFSNASMTGPMIGYENAQASPGLLGVVLGNTLNLSTATVFRTVGNAAGTCNFTNVDVAGLTGLVNGLSGLGGLATVQNALLGTYQSTGTSACTVASNGRGSLAYPNPNGLLTNVLTLLGLSTAPPAPRRFYLISPSSGYFLETGYAGIGRFEAQTGAPYTLGSLNGTYVYTSIPAASLASINTSGTLSANGAGNATTVTDLNVGVGNLNLLQLGVTASYNYQLTDATAGRFLLGTTLVLYEIAPGRFVLVDTNPLTTSPSVSLLY